MPAATVPPMGDEPELHPAAMVLAWVLMVPFIIGSIVVGLRILDDHGPLWAVLWFAVGEWPACLILVGVPVMIVSTIATKVAPSQ